METAERAELTLLSAISNAIIREGYVAQGGASLDAEYIASGFYGPVTFRLGNGVGLVERGDDKEEEELEEKEEEEEEEEEEELGLIVSAIRVSLGLVVVNVYNPETAETKTTTLQTTASTNTVRTAVLRELGFSQLGQHEEEGIDALSLQTTVDILLHLNTVSICQSFRSCKVFAEVTPVSYFWEKLCERDIGNAFGTDSRMQYISWYTAQREAMKPRIVPIPQLPWLDRDDDDDDDGFLLPHPGPIRPPAPGGDPWY